MEIKEQRCHGDAGDTAGGRWTSPFLFLLFWDGVFLLFPLWIYLVSFTPVPRLRSEVCCRAWRMADWYLVVDVEVDGLLFLDPVWRINTLISHLAVIHRSLVWLGNSQQPSQFRKAGKYWLVLFVCLFFIWGRPLRLLLVVVVGVGEEEEGWWEGICVACISDASLFVVLLSMFVGIYLGVVTALPCLVIVGL